MVMSEAEDLQKTRVVGSSDWSQVVEDPCKFLWLNQAVWHGLNPATFMFFADKKKKEK